MPVTFAVENCADIMKEKDLSLTRIGIGNSDYIGVNST
jgi:hypothetical protein